MSDAEATSNIYTNRKSEALIIEPVNFKTCLFLNKQVIYISNNVNLNIYSDNCILSITYNMYDNQQQWPVGMASKYQDNK